MIGKVIEFLHGDGLDQIEVTKYYDRREWLVYADEFRIGMKLLGFQNGVLQGGPSGEKVSHICKQWQRWNVQDSMCYVRWFLRSRRPSAVHIELSRSLKELS